MRRLALALVVAAASGLARADEPAVHPATGGAPNPMPTVEPASARVAAEAAAGGSFGERARAHGRAYVASPMLIAASLGVGVEENDKSKWPGDGLGEVTHKTPVAFSVGAELLWAGFIGPAVGLYASEGAPVVFGADTAGNPKPGLGDRLDFAFALALRPIAPVAWSRGDDYLGRLAAGVGVEVGLVVDTVRTSLDTGTGVGFHGVLSLELPLYGGASVGGLTLRLAARFLVAPEQKLAIDPTSHRPAVDEPGFATQLLAGFSYYL